MLDVGAADAFIIYLVEQQGYFTQNHLILVDAGKYSNGDKILKHLHKYYPHQKINLAIVTHCDKDHYGGFVKMLEKMQNGDDDSISILKFWVNDPSNHGIDPSDVEKKRTQKTVDKHLRSVYTVNNGSNLLDLIDSLNIPFKECFSDFDFDGRIFDDEYDCITILGPTRHYYESQILNMRNDLRAIVESEEATASFSNEAAKDIDDAPDDDSSHNQTSIIFLIELNGKKYLFTGDAGEEAFDNLYHIHRALIKNIFWLKVPHHGSDHNLSNDLIKEMNPYGAYLSSESIDHYLSQTTVDALNNVICRVYSTHIHGNMLHHGKRIGYSAATPL